MVSYKNIKQLLSLELPLRLQEEVAQAMLSIMVPVLGTLCLFSLGATLLHSPDQLFRGLPALLTLLALIPASMLRARGNVMAGAQLLLTLGLIVVSVSLIRAGGVYAPIFMGVLPVLAFVIILKGTRMGGLYLVLFFSIALSLHLLTINGVIAVPTRETSEFLLLNSLIWVLLGCAIVIIPLRLMHRLLEESRAQQQELITTQSQLLQAQKMEALGQLAGGIAHDFNNLLTAIIGHTELLKMDSTDPAAQEGLGLIETSAKRASELTGQLLSFSRGGNGAMELLNLHELIGETAALLERTLPQEIALTTSLEAAYAVVLGNQSQLQNVLMNLCINSSHAIDATGEIRVATALYEVQGKESSALAPGTYLSVSVADTGSGIPPTLLDKIFDPFFTTKEKGKGTGLGLSSTYGTISKHGGSISVASELGAGTTFTLLLPLESKNIVGEERAPGKPTVQGKATVLIVDDDPMIQAITRKLLERQGYATATASNGIEGLDLFCREKEAIDLVILDMLMPKMGGVECFRLLRAECATLPIIVMTGYTASREIDTLQEEGINCILTKPFTQEQLLEAVGNELTRRKEA